MHRTSYDIKLAVYVIDSTCIFVFTVELFLNCLSAPSFKYVLNLWVSFLNTEYRLKLFVTLGRNEDPIIFSTQVSSVAAIRVLRLFRIFRVFKIFKRSAKLRILGKAALDSLEGLSILLFSLFILVVFYSTLQFYAEQTVSYFSVKDDTWYYDNGDISPYQSIPAILFSTLVTLMGNPFSYPRSALGQIVMAATIISFVFVVAFPLVTLKINNFNFIKSVILLKTMISMSYSKAVRYYAEQSIFRKEEKLRKLREKQLNGISTPILNKATLDLKKKTVSMNTLNSIKEEEEIENLNPVTNSFDPVNGKTVQDQFSNNFPDLVYHDINNSSGESTFEVINMEPSSSLSESLQNLPNSETCTISTPILAMPLTIHSSTIKNGSPPSNTQGIQAQSGSPKIKGKDFWGKAKEKTVLTSPKIADGFSNVVQNVLEGKTKKGCIVEMEKSILFQLNPLKKNKFELFPKSSAELLSSSEKERSSQSGKKEKAGNILANAVSNLTEVNLKVVDWEYQTGPTKRIKRPKVKKPPTNITPGTIEGLVNDDSEDDVELEFEELVDKYGWKGGDKLNLTIAIKNHDQFKKLLKALSEFE
ncbi:hypothetical protein HDU92_008936 [Lobulomyces angularis]|nr:hypothetical protein HDU92_008936 [Lobulomyces angularis]